MVSCACKEVRFRYMGWQNLQSFPILTECVVCGAWDCSTEAAGPPTSKWLESCYSCMYYNLHIVIWRQHVWALLVKGPYPNCLSCLTLEVHSVSAFLSSTVHPLFTAWHRPLASWVSFETLRAKWEKPNLGFLRAERGSCLASVPVNFRYRLALGLLQTISSRFCLSHFVSWLCHWSCLCTLEYSYPHLLFMSCMLTLYCPQIREDWDLILLSHVLIIEPFAITSVFLLARSRSSACFNHKRLKKEKHHSWKGRFEGHLQKVAWVVENQKE